VYFLSMRNGPPQLFALELEGGPARRVTQHAGQDLTFSVAPSSLTKPDKTSIAGVSTSNGGSTGH
jgi:Tol biopolymer transport system component